MSDVSTSHDTHAELPDEAGLRVRLLQQRLRTEILREAERQAAISGANGRSNARTRLFRSRRSRTAGPGGAAWWAAVAGA